jgi:glucose-1-phosphate thymidylyltransferase
MKCIILAAGYATRLYPVTKDFPKPLLEVGGKPILNHIVENALNVPQVDGIIIVTNNRFCSQFEDWKTHYSRAELFGSTPVTILNDGSQNNEDRLGALGDLALAVKSEAVEDECLVLAADNLFDFSLSDFANFFYQRRADCITTHRLEDRKKLRQTGVIQIVGVGRVIDFEEKPKNPATFWAVPPFYLYREETLTELLPEYLAEGNNTDAPGLFIPWLLYKEPVYAFRFGGNRYDIGTVENYEKVKRIFEASPF